MDGLIEERVKVSGGHFFVRGKNHGLGNARLEGMSFP